MSILSKSVLNSLVASIFIINGPLYAGEAGFTAPETETKEAKEVKEVKKAIQRRIEIKAKSGKPVRVFVDSDGQEHMFELTQQELKDISEVNGKLQELDQQTMIKVKQALESVSINLEQLKNGEHLQQLEELSELSDLNEAQLHIEVAKLKELGELKHLESLKGLKELDVLRELMDEEHAFVIRERIHGDAVTVDINGLDDEDKRVFVIDGSNGEIVVDNGDGNKIVKTFVLGEGNALMKGHVDAILKLMKHGEFSADELDKLQEMLDSKR